MSETNIKFSKGLYSSYDSISPKDEAQIYFAQQGYAGAIFVGDTLYTSKVIDVSLVDANLNIKYIDNSSVSRNLAPMVSTTWAELKALRDSSNLIPGQQYRITDYQCTTTQEDTQSAGNQFDIIVVADNESTLNENARACMHDGDTYFAESFLEAWELKYSLDNDSTRFAWADTVNGKGVVYWMKDEWNNECPYDFKNIQYKRFIVFDHNYYQQSNEESTDFSEWVYTFTGYRYFTGLIKDGTLENPFGHYSNYEEYQTFHDNIIKEYKKFTDTDEYINKAGLNYLNNNVLFGYWHSDLNVEPEEIHKWDYWDYETYTAACCYNNVFEKNCHDNTFYEYGCHDNIFENDCHYNSFKNFCCYNKFGQNCNNNTFKENCKQNTFGQNCSYNSFGWNCYYNTFGSDCWYNTFGSDCWYNTFGSYCWYNTFGSVCRHNTFGSDCSYNAFGSDCSYNAFGSVCTYNTFGTSSATKSYCRYITLEPGVSYTYINCTATTSSAIYFQNVHVNSGVSGTSHSSRKEINIETAGNEFLTTICSAGDNTITV